MSCGGGAVTRAGDGRQLRVDTTVVQTDIIIRPTTPVVGCRSRRHALGRPPRRSAGTRRIKGFRDRTRSARRRMLEIQRMTTRQVRSSNREHYRELIGLPRRFAKRSMVLRNTRKTHGRDMIAAHGGATERAHKADDNECSSSVDVSRARHVGDHISAMRLAGIPQHMPALCNLLGNPMSSRYVPVCCPDAASCHPLDLQHPTPGRSCSIPEPR